MSDLADVILCAVKDLRELRNRNDVADDLEAALSLPPDPPTSQAIRCSLCPRVGCPGCDGETSSGGPVLP